VQTDCDFIHLALAYASQGIGRTSPNPAVGAVIVRDGRILGTGYHRAAGLPHAEIEALRACAENPGGATLYVTLEPCCHFGRTPPCTEAIINAGISRVVAAVHDPNPRVNGAGFLALRQAGITVDTGLGEQEAREINRAYFKAIATGLPLVTLKAAMTLDGRIAARSGDSKWISGEPSRLLVHQWRDQYDAILIGVGTILADDPLLTTRLPGAGARSPLTVIVDSHLRTPPTARTLTADPAKRTVIYTRHVSPSPNREKLLASGVEIRPCPSDAQGLSLREILCDLHCRGVNSVLCEGGSKLFTSLIDGDLADELRLFIAPLLIGGPAVHRFYQGAGTEKIADARRLNTETVERCGEDILFRGRFIF